MPARKDCVTAMKIALVEPLAVKGETMGKFAAKVKEMGHELTVYNDRDASVEGLKARSAGRDAITIANTPHPAETSSACPQLKNTNVASTAGDQTEVEH